MSENEPKPLSFDVGEQTSTRVWNKLEPIFVPLFNWMGKHPIIAIIIIALFVAIIPEMIIVGIWGIVIALIIRLFSKTDKTPIWKAGLENWYYVYKKLF